MITLSLLKPLNETLAELASYLKLHGYRNISVNYSDGLIKAERWRFLKRRFYLLQVKALDEKTTSIKVNVNSRSNIEGIVDRNEEERLRSKIYFVL